MEAKVCVRSIIQFILTIFSDSLQFNIQGALMIKEWHWHDLDRYNWARPFSIYYLRCCLKVHILPNFSPHNQPFVEREQPSNIIGELKQIISDSWNLSLLRIPRKRLCGRLLLFCFVGIHIKSWILTDIVIIVLQIVVAVVSVVIIMVVVVTTTGILDPSFISCSGAWMWGWWGWGWLRKKCRHIHGWTSRTAWPEIRIDKHSGGEKMDT